MKLAFSWLLLLMLVILQVTIGKTFGLVFAVPLSVIGLIVLAGFVNTEQLLYMSFTAGLLLDLSAGRDFGLNLSFAIFVALFCKLVMHYGQREYSWVNVVMLSVLFSTIYSLILFFLVYSPEQLNETSQYLSRLIGTVGVSLVWTLVLYGMVTKLYQSENDFKLNKNITTMIKRSRSTKR